MLAVALREAEESEEWKSLAEERGEIWNYKYYYYYKTKIHRTFHLYDKKRMFRAMAGLLNSECGDFIRFHVSLCGDSKLWNFQENDEIKQLLAVERVKKARNTDSVNTKKEPCTKPSSKTQIRKRKVVLVQFLFVFPRQKSNCKNIYCCIKEWSLFKVARRAKFTRNYTLS